MDKEIKILIIDDSPAFNHLTKITLKKAGVICEVDEASNGQKGLEYLAASESCPDVILLDINMPVMDGFDFLDEYCKSGKCVDGTLLYILTSSSQEIDKDKASSFGVVREYFEKPLTKDNIATMLSDLSLMSPKTPVF